MSSPVTDIAYCRTLLTKTLKENFLFKKNVSPVDRKTLIERYQSLINNINGFIVICNYTTGQYEYVSDGIRSHLGHDVSNYSIEELTDFVLSIIHERHREFMFNSLIPVVFKYLKENSTAVKGTDYRYSCSFKMQNAQGAYHWYLVDTTVIEEDESGLPQRTLITCTNINPFKKDDCIYYNILKKNEHGIYELLFEGMDNLHSGYQLTPREIQIINLISQGHSNKEIADKLFLTINTIKTHRKNIMKKTLCKGTADLTNFAFSRGLL